MTDAFAPCKESRAPAPLPDWRLPPGVPRSLWEYAQAEHIAADYDDFFAHNSLFDFDLAVLQRHFARPGTIVDLGAGTGRLLVPFARRGYRGLAVDLGHEVDGARLRADRPGRPRVRPQQRARAARRLHRHLPEGVGHGDAAYHD